MPKIFRAMEEENGRPKPGRSATCLGVRIEGEASDIVADEAGQVHPGTGGMSVSPSPSTLPGHRIPRRLRQQYRGATGKDSLVIWSYGTGNFTAGSIAPGLELRPDPQNTKHGFVEPAEIVALAVYEAALEATRDGWQRDESGTNERIVR